MIDAAYDACALKHRIVFKLVHYFNGEVITLFVMSTLVHNLEATEAHFLSCDQGTRECAINERCSVQDHGVGFWIHCVNNKLTSVRSHQER